MSVPVDFDAAGRVAAPEPDPSDLTVPIPPEHVVAQYTKHRFEGEYPGRIFFKHAQYWARSHNVVLRWCGGGRYAGCASTVQATGTQDREEGRWCQEDRQWYTLAQTFEFAYNQGGNMDLAMRLWDEMEERQCPEGAEPFAVRDLDTGPAIPTSVADGRLVAPGRIKDQSLCQQREGPRSRSPAPRFGPHLPAGPPPITLLRVARARDLASVAPLLAEPMEGGDEAVLDDWGGQQLPSNEDTRGAARWCAVCGCRGTGMRFVARARFSDGCFSREGWVCSDCVPPEVSGDDRAALCLAPLFKIWVRSGWTHRRLDSAPPQPACVLPWLFVGDLADVVAPAKLEALGIGAVLSLCPEWHAEDLAAKMSLRGVELVSLAAQDNRRYRITSKVWPLARAALADWMQRGCRVLVNCWGGVNRSCSVVLLWLVVCEGWTFLDAMRAVTLARGTALTNQSFRLQCWRLWRELRHTDG